MKLTLKILFISSICYLGQVRAQNPVIDSLNVVIKEHPKDTNKVNALLYLANFYYLNDPDTTIGMCTAALDLAEELEYKRGIGDANGWLGYLYTVKGDFFSALHVQQENLKIMRELGETNGLATTLNNIGMVYFELGDFKNARKYFNEALPIHTANKDTVDMAVVVNNIAECYRKENDTANAMLHYNISMNYRKQMRDTVGMGNSLNNIGLLYLKAEDYKRAEEYFRLAISYQSKSGYNKGLCSGYLNLGLVYGSQELWNEALKYGELSLKYSKTHNYVQELYKSTDLLYKTYKALGNKSKALEMLELNEKMEDSLNNIETQKALIQADFKYEYDKKTMADSLENAELIRVEKLKGEEEVARQKIYTNFGIGVAALMLIISILILRSLQERRKKNSQLKEKNEIILQQKNEVEDKNKEITDSISYAFRIQQAILPSANQFKKHLENSFVLYLPKDIVAGDFYWVEKVNNKVIYAAADCTGHGVPGAMVSVVCNNALKRAVGEFRLDEPKEILEKVREIVEETFSKNEEEFGDIKDGMDIALCSLDLNNKLISFSGANNPLYIVRNKELTEYKGDKQPVGKYRAKKPFSQQEIQLQTGDVLYTFTDGFADQFGGVKGKKYKYSQFKQFLLGIHDMEMSSQEKELQTEFNSWKGNLEQIDDICIIGIKV